MTLEEALSRPTIPVPDAGALFFGLARNAAYDAAKRGDFQTIKVGGRIVVPVAPLAERLGLKANIGGKAGSA
ncbi:DNA-binding protein [Neorhizobium sp. P12A]|uniref:DNA-binding protein n=1 Tax=Neorhizobium sp. P12A TaxID=2268027 RepID=UPI00165EAC98|nr:DNA-binding protein [Neorhizobium sp. P12A]